jgi:hypothetical protein
MKACGLLETLCNILMASGVPADILTETINTVAEVIRGNQTNQEYFANVMAPSNPPRYITRLKLLYDPVKPFLVSGPVVFTMDLSDYFLLYVICISQNTGIFSGPGWFGRYSDSLRAGWSGDQIPVDERFSAPAQTSPRIHPASYTVVTGSFPGVSG